MPYEVIAACFQYAKRGMRRMMTLGSVPEWVIPGVLGALTHHVWTRFKTRITVLPYQIEHRYLGGSADDAYFGTLKVLHNDTEVRNVYMSSVTFKNESSRDLHDLELNIAATDSQTAILVSYGKLTSSLKYLPFTDEFEKKLKQAAKGAQVVLWNHRDYKIPVLNRGDGVTVELLTTHGGGQQPSLTVGCD